MGTKHPRVRCITLHSFHTVSQNMQSIQHQPTRPASNALQSYQTPAATAAQAQCECLLEAPPALSTPAALPTQAASLAPAHRRRAPQAPAQWASPGALGLLGGSTACAAWPVSRARAGWGVCGAAPQGGGLYARQRRWGRRWWGRPMSDWLRGAGWHRPEREETRLYFRVFSGEVGAFAKVCVHSQRDMDGTAFGLLWVFVWVFVWLHE